jgi:hypothetical protein
LTGCRPGEAFALVWNNVRFDFIWFNKSYSASIKDVKVTKNNGIRQFFLYPRLTELLKRIQPDDTKLKDLVFKQENGRTYSSALQGALWLGFTKTRKNKTVPYPGVVTRLIEDGKLNTYLSPYHTRHTFITLTAWANKENSSALALLAACCENSVDVILKHYLDVDHSVTLIIIE